MATFTTNDMVGRKENIADIITNISPTKTPFTSMIGSETVFNTIYQWQEDSLVAVQFTPQLEGATAVTPIAPPTLMRNNVTQIIQKVATVSGTALDVKTYGRSNELSYQLAKRAAEAKRDLEFAYVGNAQATLISGNDAVARQFLGYQGQLDPAVVNTLGSAAALTETLILTQLQLLYVNGSEPDTIMVKPSDALLIAGFAANTGRTRFITNDDKQGAKLVNTIDVYESPYGTQSIVKNIFQRKSDCLIFEADMWKKAVLRNWFRKELPANGDYESTMLVGEFGLMHMNYSASAAISNLL